ncbi:MAG: histidine kinase [Eubacteriales bacterium]|nr:histidine kinase [Eubacteriales bacterium]
MTTYYIYLFNIFSGLASITFCMYAVTLARNYSKNGRVYRQQIREWIPIFTCCMAAVAVDLLSILCSGNTEPGAFIVKELCDYAIFPLDFGLLVLFTRHFVFRVVGDRAARIWFRFCQFLFFVFMIPVLLTPFTGWVFYIDSNNLYHRGPAHTFTQILGLLIQIGDFMLILRVRKKLKRKVFVVYLLFIVIPLIALVLQTLIYGISIVHLSTTIVLIMIYLLVLDNYTRIIIEQEKALEEARINSMLSQLKPHFLYNSLTAIMAVEKNPPATRKAIADFAKYLRGNLDSIKDQNVIPFEKELNHIQTFLRLEKLTYGDLLEVVYDIETTGFPVPPRSIQLLVEFAVHQGVASRGEGRVVLKVREGIGEYRIIIEDNGRGIPEVPDNAPINLSFQRIREQLHRQVNGKMDIKSDGSGTKVTVIIPMKDSDADD